MNKISPNSSGLIEDRINDLFSGAYSVPEKYKLQDTMERIFSLPEQTRDYLCSILSNPDYDLGNDSTLDKMLVHMVNHGASMMDVEDVFYLYSSNEMLSEMAYGYFEWEEEDQFPTTNIREVILGLRKYSEIEGLDYSPSVPIRSQSEGVQSQVQSLIFMADFLEVVHEYQFEPGVTMVHDEELASLVASYPEQVGDIMLMIEELGELNVHQMREVLSGNVHRSLSGGSL